MIGKWIDSLTDEQRDRIIEHPDPTFTGRVWWSKARNCGCLVGTVAGRPKRISCEGMVANWDAYGEAVYQASGDVGSRFPRLVRRFTPERIWRLVKARAAKANRVPVPERETVLA